MRSRHVLFLLGLVLLHRCNTTATPSHIPLGGTEQRVEARNSSSARGRCCPKNISPTEPSLPLPPYKMRGASPVHNLFLRSLSERDVSRMSIEEFNDLRPKRPTKWLMERYHHLFSLLPEVQDIHNNAHGADEIARAWSDVRVRLVEEKGLSYSNLQRLTLSINHFLQNRVDPKTFKRVEAVWQTSHNAVTARKSLAKYYAKSKESMREYWRQTKARSRLRQEKEADVTFPELLKKYGVFVGGCADALDFEERTRFFAHELRPRHAAVYMLERYLNSAGCASHDVLAALGARRHFLKAARRHTFNERQRERQALVQQDQGIVITPHSAGEHTSACHTSAEPETEGTALHELLHRVDWWSPFTASS